jgi:hypothetical protein
LFLESDMLQQNMITFFSMATWSKNRNCIIEGCNWRDISSTLQALKGYNTTFWNLSFECRILSTGEWLQVHFWFTVICFPSFSELGNSVQTFFAGLCYKTLDFISKIILFTKTYQQCWNPAGTEIDQQHIPGISLL